MTPVMMWAALCALLIGLSNSALAAPATWQTDAGVGPNEVVYTLELICPNPGFVCDLIDGYVDADTSTVTGAGSFQLDALLGELQFDQDSSQDVGSGPQPAYLTLAGSDVAFANVPFAGVPQIRDLLVFALSSPLIPVVGFDLATPGDYPFAQMLSYSGSGTVFGDLEFVLGPAIVVPPSNIAVNGTFRVLGDVDMDGFTEYELVDVTASFSFQNLTTIGGEVVVVDVTADLTVNLSGETQAPPAPVPVLGLLGTLLLVALQAGSVFVALSMRRLEAAASTQSVEGQQLVSYANLPIRGQTSAHRTVVKAVRLARLRPYRTPLRSTSLQAHSRATRPPRR
jgi:hypothetical protein